MDFYAIVLAAGLGTRMKSKIPKVLHRLCGKPMISYTVKALEECGMSPGKTIIVVGHRSEMVMEELGSAFLYAHQEQQLGTGHAVMMAQDYLPDDGQVLILTGDTPLISSLTLSSFMEYHLKNEFSATVLTAEMQDPTGYGRIIRDGEGNLQRIVEQKDATDEEKRIKEVNSSIYCFRIRDLRESLKEIKNENAQGEYYLTDTIEILRNKGKRIGVFRAADSFEVSGINSRVELAKVENFLRQRILKKHMEEGVTIIDPSCTYIGIDVKIGRDTVIYPGCHIEGNTVIGEDCAIGPNARIVDSSIGKGTEVQYSVILGSIVGEMTKIGPFAYIRPESSIGNQVKIGDFVEIKKSTIGDGAKVPHLAYIGDAEIGKRVNFSCGAIVVNYDGERKHKTVVKDNAFIGCNSNLVSPVVVEEGAYIAAGSTITENVPPYSLAIARERQVIKEDWVKRRFKNKK